MPIPSLDELMEMEVSASFDEPVPEGWYNAVITKGEVRKGKKGPYISIETTVHTDEDGDDEFRGRKVWRNASFSDNALKMPGGIAQLMQATQPEIDRDTTSEELPAVIARAITSTPVRIRVKHDQIVRQGVAQFKADGEPELRAEVAEWEAASEEFIAAVEDEAAGVDDDLPF